MNNKMCLAAATLTLIIGGLYIYFYNKKDDNGKQIKKSKKEREQDEQESIEGEQREEVENIMR